MRLAVLLVIAAGCGAELDENQGTVDARTDAPRLGDAAIDAPSVDARACVGGEARAMDPSTGSCFVYFTGPRTYVDADAACTTFGSKLAVIKSAATNAVVRSLIAQTDAFVGATDRTVESSFRWRDSAADLVTGQYTNWRTGEPNNANGAAEEDCMIIEGDQDGTWDDRPCDGAQIATAGSYAYICQF